MSEKFHIHVYKTVGLSEHDIDAESIEEALDKALEQAKQSSEDVFNETDCQLIAIRPGGLK